MKIFFDMEFTGLHQKTTPISLGAVAEDGRYFYAEFVDFDQAQIDSWLQDNVIRHLIYYNGQPGPTMLGPSTDICADRGRVRQALEIWLSQFDAVEMWSDCLAYDWVLFCELFGGGAECLPRNVYYIPFDICTLFKVKGIDPDIGRIEYSGLKATKHNALDDARIIKACHEKAMG